MVENQIKGEGHLWCTLRAENNSALLCQSQGQAAVLKQHVMKLDNSELQARGNSQYWSDLDLSDLYTSSIFCHKPLEMCAHCYRLN